METPLTRLALTTAAYVDAAGLQPRDAQPAIASSPSELLYTAAEALRWCGRSLIVDEPVRGRCCAALARALDEMARAHV